MGPKGILGQGQGLPPTLHRPGVDCCGIATDATTAARLADGGRDTRWEAGVSRPSARSTPPAHFFSRAVAILTATIPMTTPATIEIETWKNGLYM